ncbi:VWA-like domain-containing protein [Sulfurimonas sp. HSL-3221]|uniref:vWA domain-containing protein n=1 Tax=Sulfurimonadaceae TaxID=2771471 RepID=UPI001E5B92FA|nr:VWA-like domain-containing protein [Sulfurimonas sp. HSL-3221]UFS61500.1 VWA-like domain-containing protein [Sulfurimonas sp. HSL-3221]
MPEEQSDLQRRLEKIRVQFLFDHPFLSVLALSLPMRYRKNPHEAFETDGTAIYVDTTMAETIPEPQLKYIYAHTLLHIMLKHPFRMGGRDHKTWNRSSDVVINLLLDDFERVGERPEHEVMMEKYRDQSVEEVYNTLYQENPEGEGTPDDENPQEQKQDLIESEGDSEAAMEDIDALIVQAMGAAQKQGNIPASFLEVIREVTRPKIDLATLLHTYMTESFFDKQSDFSRPNRRFIYQELYLPGYRQENNRLNLYIALDRSMSISRDTFSKFLGIIDGVLRLSTDFKVTVIPFDDEVDKEKIVTYDAQALKPEVAFEKGNGGTQFAPVLEYLNTADEAAATLMVLSDGFFKIEKASHLPTLFLVSEKRNMKRFEPYGDVFYFDL